MSRSEVFVRFRTASCVPVNGRVSPYSFVVLRGRDQMVWFTELFIRSGSVNYFFNEVDLFKFPLCNRLFCTRFGPCLNLNETSYWLIWSLWWFGLPLS